MRFWEHEKGENKRRKLIEGQYGTLFIKLYEVRIDGAIAMLYTQV